MSEPTKPPSLFADAFREELASIVKEAVREEIAAAMNGNGAKAELLTPEQLAEKLGLRKKNGKPKVSWVYEQSRQGNIPTHRIGKYIRFDLAEVVESQKKKEIGFPLTRLK
jgi:hypothetical protein